MGGSSKVADDKWHCGRRNFLLYLSTLAWLSVDIAGARAQDPLPSWNDGAAKQGILAFVRVTTDRSSPNFVPPEQRFATFDQDRTLWVEHPLYTQVVFALDRVVALAPRHPEWKQREPFRSVLAGDRAAMAKFTSSPSWRKSSRSTSRTGRSRCGDRWATFGPPRCRILFGLRTQHSLRPWVVQKDFLSRRASPCPQRPLPVTVPLDARRCDSSTGVSPSGR